MQRVKQLLLVVHHKEMLRTYSLIEQTCRVLLFPLQELEVTLRPAQELQLEQHITRIKEIILMDQMLEEELISNLTPGLPHKQSKVIPTSQILLHHKGLMSL